MKASSLIVLATVFVSGCRTGEFTEIVGPAPEAAVSRDEFPNVWQAATNVLRRQRFKLDRTDRRAGLITTRPVGSQHFFEFWRDDVATSRDFWEATLCSVRRRVMVKIDRDQHDKMCLVTVMVRKERFSTPERQVTNSATAALFLSNELPDVGSGQPIGDDDTRWQDLGRDPALERRLRELILREASSTGLVGVAVPILPVAE
ncbi:MAG: hypothetical protein V3W34_00140 [Phycisphaerae bacterium]